MRQTPHFQKYPAATLLLLCVWLNATSIGLAQDNSQAIKPGFQFRTVSGYVVYYSNFLPTAAGFQPFLANLPSDVGAGGSAEIGWARMSERTNVVFSYVPSYTGRVRFSASNSLNHLSSINIIRKLTPRWTLSLNGSGSLSSLDQLLFAPTAYSETVSVPATFDGLASGILAGKFTDPRLASALGGARFSETPLASLLYGERVLNAAVRASLSYSYSPRLSITIAGGGVQNQNISENAPIRSSTSLLRDTTSENASVGFSYSLSPRTQIGGTVSGSRVYSSFEDTYSSTTVASLGRKISNRWFAQIQGGVGVMSRVRPASYTTSLKPLPTGRGSIGFKTLSHTFLGSYDRTVNDQYGLGAASTSSANVSWRWKRPGQAWSVTSNMGWQRLAGGIIGNTDGWRATAGFSRPIGQMTFLIEYAYQHYAATQQRTAYELSQSAVRMSMIWNPHPVANR